MKKIKLGCWFTLFWFTIALLSTTAKAQEPYAQEPYAQEPYAQEPYAQEPYAQEPYAQGNIPIIEKPTSSIIILDNYLHGNNMAGLRVRGRNVVIEGCRIEHNGNAGIAIDQDALVLIQDNYISQQNGTGISVIGQGKAQVTINNNQIFENKMAGLHFGLKDPFPAEKEKYMKNPTFQPDLGKEENQPKEPPKEKTQDVYPGLIIYLADNRIYSNGQSGLNCQSEYPKQGIFLIAQNNSVFKNQKGGIFIADQATVVLQNNRIYENLQAGIAANKEKTSSPQLEIYHNRIWKNGEAGLDLIEAHTGHLGVRNNWIFNNGGSGLRFKNMPMSIINNTIISNGSLAEGSGIEQKGKAGSFLIADNILAYNYKTGLSLKKKGNCSHNLLYANGGSGNCCDDCYSASKLIESKQYGGWKRPKGDLVCDPGFRNPDLFDFRLKDWSPCIDAGLPSPEYYDQHFPPSQGTPRNDLGATGGPLAIGWDPNSPLP